jgi:hypothetical protein
MPPGPGPAGSGAGVSGLRAIDERCSPWGSSTSSGASTATPAVGDECQENKVRPSASVDADLVATAEAAVAKGRSGSVGVARLVAAPGIDAGVIAV